jgi:RsiW-degrading membrane proteinase PrsW (M82 family)
MWGHLIMHSSNAGHATVGFAVYFAAIWFFVVRALVKPEAVSPWRLVGIVLFTPLVGLGMVLALEGSLFGTSPSVFSYIFGVGLPEELAKALPVFLFVFLARQLHLPPRTYLYLGAVSGLAFGAVEAVHLSSNYANGMPWDSVSTLTGYVWRLVTDPVVHACWAGISCYFIGLASVHRNKQVPLIAFGLGAAALLHGVFDFTAANWLQVAILAFSLFVFVGYVLSAERIANDYRTVADKIAVGVSDPNSDRVIPPASSTDPQHIWQASSDGFDRLEEDRFLSQPVGSAQ